MSKTLILYNPISNNKTGYETARRAEANLAGEIVYEDITQIKDISSYIEHVEPDDSIIIAGGDGTINHLINDLNGEMPLRELLYYPTGSGNDFFADTRSSKGEIFISLNRYIDNLPTVTVNGQTRRFINGIGYGLDGYCCEVGDLLRTTSSKPVSYASIAIKGLLFHFKPRRATITVDGVPKVFEHVRLAPTMKGRFYGGGMMVAPAQDRLSKDKELTLVVHHDAGRLKTLFAFPSIFKGEHIKHKDMFYVQTGHEITVRFDIPCALQIDGETILNVFEYTANVH